MKVTEIRYSLIKQTTKATFLARKAKLAKNEEDMNLWTNLVSIGRDYISYIDYVCKNPNYRKANSEAVAQKLYWILAHVEKSDIMIKDITKNRIRNQ
ncbi:hypothetical protein VCHA53O466_50382 [Vibrio chagasii]|nr:hypothetical protein VCHA53O466_50382 [Vibrio chagasii]